MIKRNWHGRILHEDAASHDVLLREVIIPRIAAKRLSGLRSIEILRRDHSDDVEVVTIMSFDSFDDIVAFQGEDYVRAYVPEEAQRLLCRWDHVSAHYRVVDSHYYR